MPLPPPFELEYAEEAESALRRMDVGIRKAIENSLSIYGYPDVEGRAVDSLITNGNLSVHCELLRIGSRVQVRKLRIITT